MKKYLTIFFSIIQLLGCETAQDDFDGNPVREERPIGINQSMTTSVSSDFQLIWQDDFNGSTIDTTKWTRITEGSPDWKNYMTDDDQVYDVSNGYLYLKGIVNPDTQTDPRPYLTGGIWTRGKYDFTYGKFEVRAKMDEGQGCWPAIWLLGSTNEYGGWPDYGEIDIMEHLNFDNFIYSTIHSNTKSSPSSMTASVNPTEFNVYGVEWYPNKIVFSINDVTTFTYNKESGADWRQWPFDRDFHLILSQQLGGSWVGNVNPNHLPVDFIIDYVKYYEYAPPSLPSGANQFVKIQMNGSTSNSWSHLTEVTLIHEGSEYVLPIGHDAPSVLGDGTGVEGASAGYYGLDSSGLLVINLGQGYSFDAVKLGVYNGDGRTYQNVEVSVSSDGITYGASVVEDVQGFSDFYLPQEHRYVKIQMNGSSANIWSHLTEVTLISDGVEFVMPTGHDAPTVLGDGIGVNGGNTGYYGLDSTGLLIVDLGQLVSFDALKLGVFNGDNRIYHAVEVSLSKDGTSYGAVDIHDVQGAQVFFSNTP